MLKVCTENKYPEFAKCNYNNYVTGTGLNTSQLAINNSCQESQRLFIC